ncbi:MAG: hypothetical protein H7263_06325 [Candidatus Sericytochromatia bacterium]|nr:hypothetical protein [Candidatus Sericytochromatia bacterium]
MSLYVLGVGGTGARCIRALTYLCSAGFLAGEKLNVYFVDADETNGNLNESIETVDKYIQIKKQLALSGSSLGNSEVFGTNIINHKVWSPFANYHNSVKLEDIFKYDLMSQPERELFEVLYPRKKRESTFENGFLGWPSVGSSIVAKEFESFDKLFNAITSDTDAKVFLMGSIFGGTGASGIPTLVKLIKKAVGAGNNESISRKIGVLLMLPYFNFKDNESDDPSAKSENFKLKTKMALEYYYNQKFYDLCDSIYTLSDNFLTKTSDETSKGGTSQKNAPHFLELYAGLIAVDFFTKMNQEGGSKYNEVSRNFAKEINWNDLLFDETIDKLGKFASFSYAYSTKIYSVMKKSYETMPHQQAVTTYPWYAKAFPNNHPKKEDAVLFDSIQNYCSGFLSWLKTIQQISSQNGITVKLVRDEHIPPQRNDKGDFSFGDFIHGKKLEVKAGIFGTKAKTASILDFEGIFAKNFGNSSEATNLGIVISELYRSSLDHHL